MRPTGFHRYVLAFNVAEFLQALPKSVQPGRHQRRPAAQKPDHWHGWLLRPRPQRPRRCTAEQRDELAPLHSITSSAMASTPAGMVKPSALTVFRLMTSSNLV